MSVLVLMYHATPALGAQTHWDVALGVFRDQIECMRDRSVEFISFSQVSDPKLRQSGKSYVSITFDDGHVSNMAAAQFLADRGIRPIAFIVRSWAESGTGELGPHYMQQADLRELSSICDLGSHGVTHRGLAELDDEPLNRELQDSRSYVGDIVGEPVDTLALPRGIGSSRVVAAATSCGYRLIADTDFDINRHPAATVHRAGVNRQHGPDYPARLASTPWLAWSVRRQTRGAYRALRRGRLT